MKEERPIFGKAFLKGTGIPVLNESKGIPSLVDDRTSF